MLGNTTRVVVVGAGRLGSVVACVLSKIHYRVYLVDKDVKKISSIKTGNVPFVETGLDSDGLKQVVAQTWYVVHDLDYVVICVDTPLRGDGVCLDNLLAAVDELIQLVKLQDSRMISVAICSTIPPQTMDNIIRPMLKPYVYSIAFIPEFLREGTALKDYTFPSRFIVGASSLKEAQSFQNLRPDLTHIFHYCDYSVAEMLKTTENCWHALKVAFANEVGRICDATGVNSQEVMQLLTMDTRQNTSSMYLKPGFAFGGSCLPKEVACLGSFVASTPLIQSILPSNDLHIDHCLDLIMSKYQRFGCQHGKVAICGLSFKPGIDDVRCSPAITLAQRLSTMVPIVLHDPLIKCQSLPKDLCPFLKDMDCIKTSSLIVLTNGDVAYDDLMSLPNVINLSSRKHVGC
jgi:GDP-mannose 6-dehydrogenase